MIEQRKDFKALFHGRKCFRTKVINYVNGSFVRCETFLPALVKVIKRKGGSSVTQESCSQKNPVSTDRLLCLKHCPGSKVRSGLVMDHKRKVIRMDFSLCFFLSFAAVI